MLFGCGGGIENGTSSAEQPQSVQVTETATVLSVRTELPAGSKTISSEMQSLLYTFSARIDAGPNTGLALKGTLVLKGERDDDGSTEVEGRLLPEVVAVTPAPAASGTTPAPSLAALKTEFEGRIQALKDALRVDIDGLSAALKRELASDATGADPSAARKETMATFKAMFDQRMIEYRAALRALTAEYLALKNGLPKAAKPRAVITSTETPGSLERISCNSTSPPMSGKPKSRRTHSYSWVAMATAMSAPRRIQSTA
jgi:hypothetical protein